MKKLIKKLKTLKFSLKKGFYFKPKEKEKIILNPEEVNEILKLMEQMNSSTYKSKSNENIKPTPTLDYLDKEIRKNPALLKDLFPMEVLEAYEEEDFDNPEEFILVYAINFEKLQKHKDELDEFQTKVYNELKLIAEDELGYVPEKKKKIEKFEDKEMEFYWDRASENTYVLHAKKQLRTGFTFLTGHTDPLECIKKSETANGYVERHAGVPPKPHIINKGISSVLFVDTQPFSLYFTFGKCFSAEKVKKEILYQLGIVESIPSSSELNNLIDYNLKDKNNDDENNTNEN